VFVRLLNKSFVGRHGPFTRDMIIWIFNHYAETPEGSATRSYDFCRALVQRGHSATIFACSFSHYRLREEHLASTWRLWGVEIRDGVRFVWLRGIPYRSNDWRRALNMLGYGALAMLRSLATRPGPDVVVGCSVHPCAGLAGLAVARLSGCPFFVEVHDLWPQVLIEFGRIRPHGMTAMALRRIESVLFSTSERVIMLWRNTQEYVTSRGLDAGKIVWIPHVVDPDGWISPERDEPTGAPFVVMYLGSFVQSMALDVVLDAARILLAKGRNDIRLVLIGDGSERQRLVSRARHLGLANLEIRAPVPKSAVPAVLAGADCLLCCFKNSPVYRYGLSMNKLCDYLMSDRPIIMAGTSAYDPVAEAGAGLTIPGEDSDALARAIETMADLPQRRRVEMARRGKAWVRKYHSLPALTDTLERTLMGRPLEGERMA